MNEQDILTAVEGAIAGLPLETEIKAAFKSDLIRRLAQAQLAAAQRLENLVLAPDLASLPIRELKARAQALGLPNYWTLTKDELVRAIAALIPMPSPLVSIG